jgi:ATP synthase subunit D
VDAIQLLVELASLQTAFLTLDEAIKTTNRRVNALDSVVRPRLENTIAYIKVRRRHPPPCLPPWSCTVDSRVTPMLLPMIA